MNNKLQRYEAEISNLKCELNIWSDTCQKLGSEKEELQKQYNKLLEEIAFLRGQVVAFEYCVGKKVVLKNEHN